MTSKLITWQTAIEQPILKEAEMQLWLVPLQQSDAELNRLRTTLSSQELARADRFVFEKHRRRYTVSQSYLRLLLSRYLQTNPEKISFSFGKHGKPYIENSPLHFNMSRSGDYALYGFILNADIGVDIEAWKQRKHIDGIVEHNFSENEQKEYRNLPEELKLEGFYMGWTCNEAFIKAIGMGLYFPLQDFTVVMDPRKPAKLIHVYDTDFNKPDWYLKMIPTVEKYSAAYCINALIQDIKAYKF